MTKHKITTPEEYTKGLHDLLIKLGDRRFAERKLAYRIQNEFYKDPSLTAAERKTLLDRAERMLGCRVSGFHGIRKNKIVTAWTSKCNQVRLCPDESRAEGARLGSRYLEPMRELLNDPAGDVRCFFMVMTTPNAPRGSLRAEKRSAFSRWKKIWDRARKTGIDIGGGTIEGVFMAMEDPLSAAGDWNVHINALMFVKGGFDYAKWRELWGYNVEIKHVSGIGMSKALLEVVKYSVKHISGTDDEYDEVTGEVIPGAPGLADWKADEFAEWWKAGQKFRRVRTYGALQDVTEKGEDDEEAEEDDPETHWIGRVRYGVVSGQYTATWRKQEEAETTPNVDLIMVDKCGKPHGDSLSKEIFQKATTQDIQSRAGADLVDGLFDQVGTGAKPLPLTATKKNTLSVAGSGGFIPEPDAETRAQVLAMERALERENRAFVAQKALNTKWFLDHKEPVFKNGLWLRNKFRGWAESGEVSFSAAIIEYALKNAGAETAKVVECTLAQSAVESRYKIVERLQVILMPRETDRPEEEPKSLPELVD